MRGVLWLAMIFNELLTCGALRRMEHDADSLETAVAGLNDFVRTSELFVFLSIAFQQARLDCADTWEQLRLGAMGEQQQGKQRSGQARHGACVGAPRRGAGRIRTTESRTRRNGRESSGEPP